MKAVYLQTCNLFSKALLLFGQDALVQLSVGLHDAVLGRQHRQHFLKIKILTRERQPWSNTQAHKQINARTYARMMARQTIKWQAHTSEVKSQMTSQKPITRGAQAFRGVQTQHKHAQTRTINANATTTRDAERKEDNERENRTGHECLTFQHKLLHLHQMSHSFVCVCFHPFRVNTGQHCFSHMNQFPWPCFPYANRVTSSL